MLVPPAVRCRAEFDLVKTKFTPASVGAIMNHMTAHDHLLRLHDAVALWRAGLSDASEVVMTACDALVAGLDGPALRMLAGVSLRDATYDLPDYLPDALAELGLEPAAPGTLAGQEAAVRALGRQLLAGKITPRNMVRRIHAVFGYDLPLAEGLALLDNTYDEYEYERCSVQEVDDEVVAEAKRILSNGPANEVNFT
jgi:hypothetical protein